MFTHAGAAFPPVVVTSGELRVGDLDGDGAPDLLAGGTLLLHNDGSGVFRDETARLTSTPLANVVWADLDRDGDEDLLHRDGTGPIAHRMTLTENRQRGAASLQTVRPGGQLQVRFHVNPLPAVASSLVLPFAAFAPGAPHAIPGFAGTAAALLPPHGAAVLGALVVTGLQPGFTNVVDECRRLRESA